MTTKAYLTIGTTSPQTRSSKSSTTKLGNLTLHLHSNIVPRTVHNFLELLRRNKPHGYIGSSFHRLIPGFMIQGGDFTAGDGTGGHSIYNNDKEMGGMFDDENFVEKHSKQGVLSMANSGPNTNGSQFYITFKRCPHLDGKHVVFGCVDLEDDEGRQLLQRMEEMKVTRGSGNVPKVDIVIMDGGVIEEPKNDEVEGFQAVDKEIIDDDEIDLEDEDHQQQQQQQQQQAQEDEQTQAIHEESTTTDNNAKITKKKKLQDRFRKLKLKMNQSTRLNHAEVVREGERLGSEDAIKRHAKHISKEKKERLQAEWKSVHSKALEISSNADDDDDADAKYMVQPANESLRKVQKDAEKQERNRFGVNDYYNPEGQLRNYERSLRTIRPGQTYTTNDTNTNGSEKEEQRHLQKCHQNERDGARRLASELERRANKAAKRKLDREEMNFDGADIGHINQRNKRFNEKINRNYDRHTVEIKQNLERGTAL